MKWSEKDRYEIGKYASVNGPAANVRRFRQGFPTLNENTARTFCSRVVNLPRFQFPNSFSLSVNEKRYSNAQESLKFFNEIIIPYNKEVRSSDGLSANQYALVMMDVFTGQLTSDVLNLLRDNKILLTNVPANMTKFYQPLDLTVNGYEKRFMAQKFNDWYTQQVSAQLDKGIAIDEIDIKLRLSLLKPLHAEWLVDFYNHMTSGAAKKIIDSGWASSGIEDTISMGLDSLPSIDPFSDIAPMIVELHESSPPFQ